MGNVDIPIADSVLDDKKKNAKYWDEIDNHVMRMLDEVMEMSVSKIDRKVFSESNAHAVVRDCAIEQLRALGGVFPYVDENM